MAKVPAAALLLALAAGCPADRLGVDVPRGGAESISQEDLKRDHWLLSGQDAPPDLDGSVPERLSARLQQMHLLPAFGEDFHKGGATCGLKDGRSGEAVLIFAEASQGPLVLALLVSLAKAHDNPAPPEHSVVICAFFEGGRAAYPVAPPVPLDKTRSAFELGGQPEGVLGSLAVKPLAVDAAGGDPPDYRQVARELQALLGEIGAP